MTKKRVDKLSFQEKRRIEETRISYRKMWKEIEPFTKKRKVKEYSTIGEWEVSS